MLALINVELDERKEAAAALRLLGEDDFASVPHDLLWTHSLTVLSEVCATVDDELAHVRSSPFLHPIRVTWSW